MSKIIITVELTYEDIMEHEVEQEVEELVKILECDYGSGGKSTVKSVQVIHQEEDKT